MPVMPKKITSIRITSGQTVCAIDARDKTIPELQISLLELFAAHAEARGYDANGALCEIAPGDNWRIVQRGSKWSIESA